MRLRPLKLALIAAAMLSLQGCVPRPIPAAVAPLASVQEPVAPMSSPDIAARIAGLAPDADPAVIRMAVEAQQCAVRHGDVPASTRLAVIDYSRPSTEPRLWVFDIARERLLYREHVAHGRNTGDDHARRFSNIEGSLQSSLGLFRTAETYDGGNGYSLRMDGLEPGFNDAARTRAIVMHGAWYVDPVQARRQGRLGRSQGCPALRTQVAREVIDTLKQGQLLFAYYPDPRWLAKSRYLACHQDERSGGGLHATAR